MVKLVNIPERDHWLDDRKYSLPMTTITAFTDGSRSSSVVGAVISFNLLSEALSIPLGQTYRISGRDICYL